MQGLHLTNDLTGCDPALAVMSEPAALRALCLEAVAQAGLRGVGELFHRFPEPAPGGGDVAQTGLTGVVLLAESHLAVHTWPERRAVTLDVYVCNLGRNNRGRARWLMRRLGQAFGAQAQNLQWLERGQVG